MTEAVIARPSRNGSWEGRHISADGYPLEGAGDFILALARLRFRDDIPALRRYLIDDHPGGFMTLGGADPSLQPRKVSPEEMQHVGSYPPSCWCHRTPNTLYARYRKEPGLVTPETLDDILPPYIYILENHGLRLLCRSGNGFRDAGVIGWDEDPGRWHRQLCGDDLEYCSHKAVEHFPELKDLLPPNILCKLDTQQYLGREPMDFFRNAYAVRIRGVEWTLGGSGGRGGPSRASTGPDPDGWYEIVRSGTETKTVKVATVDQEGAFHPAEGVEWVFPPTRNDLEATQVKG